MAVLAGPINESHLYALDLCSFETRRIVPHVAIDSVETLGGEIHVHGTHVEDDPTSALGFSHLSRVVEGWLEAVPLEPERAVFLEGVSPEGGLYLTTGGEGPYPLWSWKDGVITEIVVNPEDAPISSATSTTSGQVALAKVVGPYGDGSCVAVVDPLGSAVEVDTGFDFCDFASGRGSLFALGSTPKESATLLLDDAGNELARLGTWRALAWLDSGRLLAADADNALGIVDIADPTTVLELGSPDLPGPLADAARIS